MSFGLAWAVCDERGNKICPLRLSVLSIPYQHLELYGRSKNYILVCTRKMNHSNPLCMPERPSSEETFGISERSSKSACKSFIPNVTGANVMNLNKCYKKIQDFPLCEWSLHFEKLRHPTRRHWSSTF
jgi:hypothetical protein